MKGRPFCNMAFLALLKLMNSGETKKWLDPACGKPITRTVVRRRSGHGGNQVERAYRRLDVLDKRGAAGGSTPSR